MKRRIGKSLLTLTLVFVMLFGSADYAYAKTTQEKLDEALRNAYGEIDPFEERYPNCKKNQYWPKGYKGGK